ncbi:MAG: class I SAM-dependent methyltransferase [Anaerolineae bacterium]|nr:class I SAM-dependent methyltransferase [Anaerolineae bacterium]
MHTDLDRLRTEYARRRQSESDKALYSTFNPAYLFALQQRQRATIQMLRRRGLGSLAGKHILEIGCGSGGVLLEYLGYGTTAASLAGIDLLPARLIDGHHRLPGLALACADGQKLPFPSGHFDLVLQYTAFSSVLDLQIKANMAAEMVRVVRKPDGLILWYDFWLNPNNPHTKGICPEEIKQLFSSCNIHLRRTTLAPPITRRLVRVSWILCELLENLRLLNSHYLAIIRPN